MVNMTHDEMRKQAEEKYPILATDCRTTRLIKQLARDDYFKKLRKLQEEGKLNSPKLQS